MSFLTPSTRPLRAVCVSFVGWLLVTGSGWSATTIDTFDSAQTTVAGGATGTRLGSMLGGVRTLAPQAGGEAGTGGGVLRLGQAAAGSGLVQVIWDGPAHLKTGLGAVSLTSGGDDAFLLGVTAANQAATLTLQVWTDDTHLSSVDVAVAATAQPSYYRVPFSTLTGTANFGSVGAVGLALKLGATANSVQVDFLRTTKTTESEPLARLTDVVLVDRNGDGRAGAGDTLRYFVTVTNPGLVTLTNVQVSAPVPAHTADVAGSLAASPLARAVAPTSVSAPGDAWHVAFDTAYERTAGEGLLGGSFLGMPAAAISSFGGGLLGGTVGDNAAGSATTVDGHQLRVNADGSLAYTPKPGFTGLFSFQYRIANATGASTATAQIAVGARPAAKADALALVGNLAIQPSSTQGVILSFGGAGADVGSALQVLKVGKDAATVTVPTGSATATETAEGGSMLVQADGSFVYNPKAGFTGDDSFYYQIDNGFNQPSVAKVTLTVARRVWFINPAVAINGDGRYGTPFNSIANFVTSAGYTAAATGDVVYLYSGSVYSGAYTLKAGQTLAGQSVALNTLVPVPAYSAGPATAPTAPAWATAQITLPAGGGASAVRGLALAGTTGTLISGTGAGATTLAGLTLTPTASAAGIALTSGTADVAITGVTLNANTSGVALRITGGAYSATIDSTSAITQSGSGNVVSISAHTAGTLTLAAPITASAGAGINLSSNTGATIAFTGTLALSTGANAAFAATGGGTVTATSADSTIAVTTGQALNVANTAIGAAGLKFKSISANGSATAISLNNTGTGGTAGGLSVTGAGSAASGGVIQNTTGTAISLTSTKAVALSWLNVQNCANSSSSAIAASTVAGLTLTQMDIKAIAGSGIAANTVDALVIDHCNVQQCATAALRDGTRSGLQAGNLTGTCAITESTFVDSTEDQIRLMPTSGAFALTITGGRIGFSGSARPANGGMGLVLVTSGTANATVAANNVTFANNYSSALLTSGGGSSLQTVNAIGCTFTNNWVGVDLAHDGTGDMTTKIENNTLTGSLATAIRAGTTATAAASLDVNAVVRGNMIGTGTADSGARDGYGIALDLAGDAVGKASVTGNTVRNTDVQGFYGQSRLPAVVGGTNALDLTYLNNTVSAPDNNSASPYGSVYGTVMEARNTRTLRLDIGTTNNVDDNVSASAGGVPHFRLRLRDTATFGLAGLGAPTNDLAAVASFVTARNASGSTADATLAAGRTFTPASVTLPSNN